VQFILVYDSNYFPLFFSPPIPTNLLIANQARGLDCQIMVLL
jgi:hypothetical protein